LVVSLRQPVARAYSAYWHNLRHGRLPVDSDFSACLAADEWGIRSRGEYFTHLGRYLRHFPRSRLLVLLYDLIQEDPARELRACLEFLGVDPTFTPSTLQARLNEGRLDITSATGPVHTIRSALRAGFLWAEHRRLVPQPVQRRFVATADRLARIATGLGRRARPYEPLDLGLASELLERYYRVDIDRLEDLLDLDLSRWRDSSLAPANAAPVSDKLQPDGSQPT